MADETIPTAADLIAAHRAAERAWNDSIDIEDMEAGGDAELQQAADDAFDALLTYRPATVEEVGEIVRYLTTDGGMWEQNEASSIGLETWLGTLAGLPSDAPITTESLAGMIWDAWTMPADGVPLTAEAFTTEHHFFHLRLAWALMHQAKPELVEGMRDLGAEAAFDAADNIQRTAELFKVHADMLRATHLRMLSAIATLGLEAGPGAAEFRKGLEEEEREDA